MLFAIAFVSGLFVGTCVSFVLFRGMKTSIHKQIMESYKKSMLGDP